MAYPLEPQITKLVYSAEKQEIALNRIAEALEQIVKAIEDERKRQYAMSEALESTK
jgi:hypothetical protein